MTTHAMNKGATRAAGRAPTKTKQVKTARMPSRKLSAKVPGAANLGIPRTMREAPRWLVWQYVPSKRKPGKLDKVPVGKWRDPKHWRSYTDAAAACKPGQLLGFVLGDGWAGIDVDGAWADDGTTLQDHAARVWKACGKSGYAERSPSGKGYKVFVHFDAGDVPAVGQATETLPGDHVEVAAYHTPGRWFAVTGDALADCGKDPNNPAARKGYRATFARLQGQARDRVRSIDDADGLADLGAVRPYTPEREADLRAALSLLPNDDRKQWVDFGHALKAMGWAGDHADAAFDLWREWSEHDYENFDEDDCYKRWKGFRPRGAVSVATIFFRAKEVAGDASEDTSADEAALLAELSKPIPLRKYGLEEFMAMKKKAPPQLVPGLLAPGLTLLIGRQKSGKTYMLLQLAVALATGGEFLGVRVAKPLRVKAYLLEEAGETALQQERFDAMGYNEVFRNAPQYIPNLELEFGDMPPIDKGGMLRLTEDLAAFDVVLVDSATALDYGEVGRGEMDVFRRHYREMQVLQRAARKNGKCLLVLTHARKGSDLYKATPGDMSNSTGGTTAAVDCSWGLQEDTKRTDNVWRLTVQGRYPGTEPLAVQHDKAGGGHWRSLGRWADLAGLAPLPDAANETAGPTLEQRIVDLLPIVEPATTEQVAAGCPGHNKQTVVVTLSRMRQKGKVQRRPGPRMGAQGRPASLWELA